MPEGCCTKKRFVRMKGAERGRFFPLFSGLRMWSKMLKRIISFARSFPSERYLASSAYGTDDAPGTSAVPGGQTGKSASFLCGQSTSGEARRDVSFISEFVLLFRNC